MCMHYEMMRIDTYVRNKKIWYKVTIYSSKNISDTNKRLLIIENWPAKSGKENDKN